MRGGWLPRAEVDGEQGVPGGGVAAGHVVEDEARGGEVAVVGVGGEESGPGDDVPTGHLVEQLLGVAEAAAAAVRREQRIEVGRVGAARRGIPFSSAEKNLGHILVPHAQTLCVWACVHGVHIYVGYSMYLLCVCVCTLFLLPNKNDKLVMPE